MAEGTGSGGATIRKGNVSFVAYIAIYHIKDVYSIHHGHKSLSGAFSKTNLLMPNTDNLADNYVRLTGNQKIIIYT